MTADEKEILLSRVQLAESRAVLADARSLLALQIAVALRDTFAARYPEFDRQYVRQLASMPSLLVPTKEQVDSQAKLFAMLDSLMEMRQNLAQPIRDEHTEGETL